MLNTIKSIEFFHLLFLNYFSKKVSAELYSLKGGCNLRFFFNSIRYSEDLDLDIATVSVNSLKNTINKITKDKSFNSHLLAKGITISKLSEPKQTETTQRWKFLLTSKVSTQNIPTKIEFSRRIKNLNSSSELINEEITLDYQIIPFILSHYKINQAIEQKIDALANRRETQTRDLFDLYFLVKQSKEKKLNLSSTIIENALNNSRQISFEQYLSQVISFIAEEHSATYNTEVMFNKIKNSVLAYLGNR